MTTPLQPGEESQRRQGGERSSHEERRPADGLDQIAGAGREQRAPRGGERRQQCILRCSVEGIAAQRRYVGDEDHRADRTAEILDDDRHRQCRRTRRLLPQPHEDQVRQHLQDGAEPQRRRHRQRARHGAAGKAADQKRREPQTLDDRRIGGLVVAKRNQHERRGHRAGQRVAQLVEQHERQDRQRSIA